MQTFEDLWNAFVEHCGQEAPSRTRAEFKNLVFTYGADVAGDAPIYDRVDTTDFWEWVFEDGWAWGEASV